MKIRRKKSCLKKACLVLNLATFSVIAKRYAILASKDSENLRKTCAFLRHFCKNLLRCDLFFLETGHSGYIKKNREFHTNFKNINVPLSQNQQNSLN